MASTSTVAPTYPKTLITSHLIHNPKLLTPKHSLGPTLHLASSIRFNSLTHRPHASSKPMPIRAALNGNTPSKRSSSSSTSNEQRETIMLPGCDFNHWLIVMEFPKDPAPTREQMIETYLDTLATVLGSMEEAKKNMYAFSTTTYTGFQCTVSEETSEKFKGLPGVLWVLPDSYIDVKNKDYGGDKYINGEIIPCTYPTYQPKQRSQSKFESRRYERRKSGPAGGAKAAKPTQAAESESNS
ncbi:hypothetical protein RHMOL_Rhmol04G0028300 [Rhododendron molle]|uniref:Uncharacterized protein n=2 Tax=Rhododendron molle TaxID=49168 RepID=A0ACC0NWI5_RHOML|nr:hypothetical protein RHMOL_Rhmol04G0028300 [Rhododendron molle]KAI8557676.1 hypothetical protein RHMOL_Rhmol04G0028300 [Rhododendron molle]